MKTKKTDQLESISAVVQKALFKDLMISDLEMAEELRLQIDIRKLRESWQVTNLHVTSPSESLKKGNRSSRNNADLQLELTKTSTALADCREMMLAAQEQLIEQEKLSSLGQLTAGIAHEIKNPLNFITNFSELSVEYINEIHQLLNKIQKDERHEEISDLLNDIRRNLNLIHNHGTRAHSIVKSMLLHSRGGSGAMEPVDLNALIKEYVNLAFHGMRANNDPINVTIDLQLDKELKEVMLNPESFSRVILNLCKNAFDAMREKVQTSEKGYLPKLRVKTLAEQDKVLIEFEDNGPGIPEEIRDKLLMPFFTTKKGVEGTGLGLSISHDIIKTHGGIFKIESVEGEYARFKIILNIA
ncbi:sensor histidine kinase [Salinimicrobium soli]|uniref:sensor histidine kinase n=1 Tax=Salinimicrobium soli TaxID=1254399 RepID=UPI003AAF4788